MRSLLTFLSVVAALLSGLATVIMTITVLVPIWGPHWALLLGLALFFAQLAAWVYLANVLKD